MIMGYMLVTAVLVVSLGRLGDIYGRVRTYNLGFVVFTIASVLLALTPGAGTEAATWLILWRLVQGVGGAMLMANSAAIITDAFPANQRGLALGVNQVAGLSGSFIGLIVGGLLSEWHWRAVFWVSVPFGILGTVWAYRSLHELAVRVRARIDWLGNLTFGLGLTILLVGITYGIQPYGGADMGWTNPLVLAGIFGGLALLGLFVLIEARVPEPMFHLAVFRGRPFVAGNAAGLLSAIARGGLQFMLIIWLQGIWLPLRGYDYEITPLWAAIYLLPLTLGFLVSGPVSGRLSDRYGARAFATGGLVLVALTFIGLLVLPVDFDYWVFALLIALNGVGSGLFTAPNTSSIMNSVPAHQRGAASGMRATFQNAGMLLSIGVFFSLMIVGLSTNLPDHMRQGLVDQGVPAARAAQIAELPPVGTLFSAFLGYNPMEELLGEQVLDQLPPENAATLTGKEFFPDLIAPAFHDGLVTVFLLAAVMSLIGAGASMLRGQRYVYGEDDEAGSLPAGSPPQAVGRQP
jgi:MFS family permease